MAYVTDTDLAATGPGQGADMVGFSQTETGAVTRTAMEKLREFVSPEDFGAAGDGVADDSAALQAALDAGRSVRLTPGNTYLVKSKLVLSSSDVSLTGTGTVKVASDFDIAADVDANGSHMRVLFVTGSNVTIADLTYDATDAPSGTAPENGFIWSTGAFNAVRDCYFIGNPKGTCVWAMGAFGSVMGCRFVDCSGAIFARGRNAVIANNIIINATDAAIALNGQACIGAVVSGNSISNENATAIPSMIAVEQAASNWTIASNTLTGVSGGGVICLNTDPLTPVVEGGTIIGNVIDGRRVDGVLQPTVDPAALIAISEKYENCIVTGNQVRNCPAGNVNSRLAILPATGTVFSNNIVDGSATEELSALITIIPGDKGIKIESNKTVAADTRHYLFYEGDYAGLPCIFVGGFFYGGTVGIDAEAHVSSISNLALNIIDIADVTATDVVNASTILGDRSSFLNAGAWAHPHRIGPLTEMHCDAIPANAGRRTIQLGDKFYYLNPASAGYIGVVRVPGAWKSFGALV